MLQLFSYVAQTERELNHQRTMEGIAAAKARGVQFGRKPMVFQQENLRRRIFVLRKEFDAFCRIVYRSEY